MSLNLFSSSLLRNASPITRVLACRWISTSSTSSTAGLSVLNSQSSRVSNRRRSLNRQKFIENQRAQGESKALEKFQTRDWKAGDIYAPHDLSPAEMKNWSKRQSPERDAFDALNLNPLDLYKNFSVMSEYISPTGRIRHRSYTGLRPVNQRKLARAIKRAMRLGLMPSVHRHPEILAAAADTKGTSGGRIGV